MCFGPLATTPRSLIATADSQTSSFLTPALQGLQAVATGCTDQLLKFAAAPAFTLLLTVPCGPPEHTGLIPARRPLPLSVRVRGSAPLCCLGAPWPRDPWKACSAPVPSRKCPALVVRSSRRMRLPSRLTSEVMIARLSLVEGGLHGI